MLRSHRRLRFHRNLRFRRNLRYDGSMTAMSPETDRRPVTHEPGHPTAPQTETYGQVTEPPVTPPPGRKTGDPVTLLKVFYAVIATIALVGQATGLGQWMPPGVPGTLAVTISVVLATAIELLAAVLLAFADWRRTVHRERAIPARLLSLAVAAGVATLNWFGHPDQSLLQALFVGASIAGYLVWVIHTSARRRDALVRQTAREQRGPDYGIDELLHPHLVRRARRLWAANQKLGRWGSLHAARAEVAAERRRATIAKALRRKLSEGLDPLAAEIAVASYDLDRIAVGLASRADHDQMVTLLAADLDPGHLTGDVETKRRSKRPQRPVTETTPAPVTVTDEADEPPLLVPPAWETEGDRTDETKPKGDRTKVTRETKDPYVTYADQISAIQEAIGDWRTREKPITAREVEEFTGITGQPTKLKIRALIEAISDRAPKVQT